MSAKRIVQKTMGRPTSTDTSMRFIGRMHDPLWRVWITFGDFDSGQRYFSDREHGGIDQSLAAAKQFRDKIIKKHKIPLRVYDGNGFTIRHTKNKSGTVGLRLTPDRRKDPVRWSWVGCKQVDGQTTVFGRSIRTHGYEKAWSMVAKIREAHTGMKVPSKPPPPTQELIDWAASNGYDVFDQQVTKPKPKIKPVSKKKQWPFL